jgi:hypothetical protein
MGPVGCLVGLALMLIASFGVWHEAYVEEGLALGTRTQQCLQKKGQDAKIQRRN